MAKILYGVAGEGFGHSSRSELIGRRLLDCGHDVLFAASGKSLSYLSQPFTDRVNEVYGLRFIYQQGRIHPFYTMLDNVANYRHGFWLNRQLFEQKVEALEPDLVISDFEPFSAWWAWRNNVPCIFVDHEHFLTMLALENVPSGMERFRASLVTRGYHTFAQAYVMLNFFRAPLRNARAVLASPVVRHRVTELTAGQGEQILVYSTDSKFDTKQKYISVLGRLAPRPFVIYGFNVEEQHGNCLFKKTGTEAFLRDLANCAGVISTAGFSLLSECLYLKKRMLLFPIKGQFEQQVNAVYAQRLGFARHVEALEPMSLELFLNDLEKEFPSHDRIIWPDNEAFFDTLDMTLNRCGCPLHLSKRRAATG